MRNIPLDMHYRIATETLNNGGGTFSPMSGGNVDISNVYVVSALPKCAAERVIELTGIARFDHYQIRDDVRRFLDHNRAEWLRGRFLGTWLHDDKVYLDVVETFTDQHKAHTAAIERGQLAYFDGRNGITRHVGSRRR